MASFTQRIGISILWCSHTVTIDEHNNIIAGDIITLQKRTDKMSCYYKFDRTHCYHTHCISIVKPITDPEKIGPKD